MPFDALERETVITLNDAEEVASVYTAQRRKITQLKKNPAAVLIEEGVHDGSPWARFELPKNFISFRTKTRTFCEAERSRRAAQLSGTHKTRVAVENADSSRRN
jgi:hypothetical protein